MSLKVNLEENFLISTVWYSRFQIALSEKKFDLAESYFKKYKYFKRKSALCEYLDKLCDEVGFYGK